MRIIYIGKHNSGGNDDEGAVTHALRALGHEVVEIHENNGRKAIGMQADFILFNKWFDVQALRHIKIPRVFWYWDLVDFPDPTLRDRCNARKLWMKQVTPHVDLGFCTDGDWVANDASGKLHWLTQGADERVVGRGVRTGKYKSRILFTGGENGGEKRQSFVVWMKETYGELFLHVSSGVHGRALADLIAEHDIVVAPDGPVTDRYWSNRVYLTSGFGGFLLHPWCEGCGLFKRHEVWYPRMYNSREHLAMLLKEFLQHSEWLREEYATITSARTMEKHLYRHRCESLIDTVKERLHV